MRPKKLHIAIVGLGPKGLYAFERLCAQLNAQHISTPAVIHLFNDNPYWGAGQNYRFDQGEHLLVNFNIGYINIWPDLTPPPVVPAPLSLTQWLNTKSEHHKPVDERSFVSRAVVGEYLHDCWQNIIANAPSTLEIVLHKTKVEDLIPQENQWKIVTQDETDTTHLFDQVLLTTGHQRKRPDEYDQSCITHCKNHQQSHFVPFAYPLHQHLKKIPTGADVAIKGMGLTYVDTVLELTEGRGGKFIGNPQSGYEYQASGLEPNCIYPFSRSGLPMFPRGHTYGNESLPLRFFREEKLATLSAYNDKLNWNEHLLPLLLAEQKAAYYHRLFEKNGEQLPKYLSIRELDFILSDFHRMYPATEEFSPNELLDPFAETTLLTHELLLSYFQKLTKAATAGEEQSPLAAAAAVWRYANPVFSEFYNFGGLSPNAQATFLSEWAGNLNRITYGMPLVNAQKLIALAEVGLINFSYARSAVVSPCRNGGFLVEHPHQPSLKVSAFIDARIPKTSLQSDANPLYTNLLKRALIRPYVNSYHEQTDFTPGCLDLTPRGQVINEAGEVVKNLSVTGIPTEGVTFDNDTLSPLKNNFGHEWAKRVTTQLTTTELSLSQNQLTI